MFADELSKLAIRLTPDQSAQFDRYLDLLQEWSKRMNLVGDASADVVRIRHFAESIARGTKDWEKIAATIAKDKARELV